MHKFSFLLTMVLCMYFITGCQCKCLEVPKSIVPVFDEEKKMSEKHDQQFLEKQEKLPEMRKRTSLSAPIGIEVDGKFYLVHNGSELANVLQLHSAQQITVLTKKED